MNAVSPAVEVQLVASRDLRKSLRSVKGLILLALTLLGGGGFMYISLRAMRNFVAAQLPQVDASSLELLRTRVIHDLTGSQDLADYLGKAPLLLLYFGYISVKLTPALCALAGFDTVSGELQHRSNRFWTVRVRKSSYLLGKFVALFLAVVAITLPLHLAVAILAVTADGISVGEAFTWAPRIWLWWMPIAAAWSALVIFASSLVRKPFFALVLSLFGAFAVWILGKVFAALGDHYPGLERLAYIDPSANVTLLASGNAASTLAGFGLTAAFAVSLLAIGVILFDRSDT